MQLCYIILIYYHFIYNYIHIQYVLMNIPNCSLSYVRDINVTHREMWYFVTNAKKYLRASHHITNVKLGSLQITG